jgi:hypothetical protein
VFDLGPDTVILPVNFCDCSYVDSLSSKKQDKALIHAKRARNIKAVLIDKKTTAVESAQFR